MRRLDGMAARRGTPMRGVVVLVVMAVVAAMFVARAQASTPPVVFGAPTDLTTGAAPHWVAVADLNGDTAPDFAVANGEASTVSVLLGDGVAGFGAKTDFATGSLPTFVVAEDVNADTFPDLVVVNRGSNSVSVLLGDGSGDFGAKTDFATGVGPSSVTVGDVSGDTFLDLVVANNSGTTVSVLLGDGAGGFGPKTDLIVGTLPYSVALVDLDDDTFLDLIVGHNTGVSVLLGDGAGGFGPQTDFATGTFAAPFAVGDLNGDALLDLAVPNAYEGDVSVLLGDGAGGFGPKTDFATRDFPAATAMGDLNGDTFVDLAVPHANSLGGVSVLLGDGTGSFGTPTIVDDRDNHSYSLALADLDGDAVVDLVVTNTYSNLGTLAGEGVSVLLNTGAVPDGPMLTTAVAGIGSATVSWTAPPSDGGRPISGYAVTPYIGYFPLPSQTFSSTTTTQVVTGLSPGTEYRFRVQAVNVVGTGGFSKASNLVTVPTVPGTPTIGPATGGDGQATVSWTAPVSDGGSPVTGYVVTPYVGYFPLASQTFSSTATTQVVTGLANGTQYRFRVQAFNAIGTGGHSKATNPVTPAP